VKFEKRRWERQTSTCIVPGCEGTSKTRSLCNKHYTRWQRYGVVDLPASAAPSERFCRGCNETKPMDAFGRRGAGWVSRCKTCTNASAQVRNLAIKYGMTLDDYERMHAQQSGVCAICMRSSVYKGEERRLAVDHDHTTGKVRGLLCQTCNRVLGLVDDNVEVLRRAIDYLEMAQ
jgi:hypothetical protein